MRRQCSWGENCMTILSMNGNQYRWNLWKHPLDRILNLTLIFYSIFPVLVILHLFTKTSSVTGKIFLNQSRNSIMYYISLLGFNKFIIVDNSYANFSNFSTKHVSFVSDLVTDEDRNFKLWETLKNEYHLSKLYFQ